MSGGDTVGAPLGEREGQRLELKSAAVLERPERIAREVVAMLNAEGGEVWVGVREEGGVAMEIEPIVEAEREKERLLDYLVDTLSPSPRGEEVRVQVVQVQGVEEGGLLRLRVRPHEGRRPFALVRGGKWEFFTRVGSRLRPMERGELFASTSGGEAGVRQAEEQINEEKKEKQAAGEPVLWLRVQPVPALDLDLQDSIFEELASNPVASANRLSGWTFADARQRPRLTAERIAWSRERVLDSSQGTREITRTEFRRDGGAEFEVALDALRRGGQDLWPIILLEYPVSGLRLARQVYEEGLSTSSHVVADLALFAVGKRMLRPGSPDQVTFLLDEGVRLTEGEDAVSERPLVFTAREFLEETDRCGFRLLRRVYQAFGLREDDIPRELDRRTGRLVLPE